MGQGLRRVSEVEVEEWPDTVSPSGPGLAVVLPKLAVRAEWSVSRWTMSRSR